MLTSTDNTLTFNSEPATMTSGYAQVIGGQYQSTIAQYWNPAVTGTCPNCGYCPCCGRSRQTALPHITYTGAATLPALSDWKAAYQAHQGAQNG